MVNKVDAAEKHILGLERKLARQQSIQGFRILGILYNTQGRISDAIKAFSSALVLAQEHEDEHAHELEELLSHVPEGSTNAAQAIEMTMDSCMEDTDPKKLTVYDSTRSPLVLPITNLAFIDLISEEDDEGEQMPACENISRKWPVVSDPMVKQITI